MIKVIGRELQIPQSERNIGFESDNLYEERSFYITDKALFDLSFKLDVAECGCAVDLEKSMILDGSALVLTWTITNSITQNSGRINVQLRAFDTESSLVWHSEMQTFFVGEAINASKAVENVPLTEFEQIEIKATAAKEEAKAQAVLAQGYAQECKEQAEKCVEDVQEHKEDASNPHNVTASQVGAYTKSETDSKLDEFVHGATFGSHAANTDNPHKVTAKQTGAYDTRTVKLLLLSKSDEAKYTLGEKLLYAENCFNNKSYVQVAISGDECTKIAENVGADVLIRYTPEDPFKEDIVNISGNISLLAERADYKVFGINVSMLSGFSAFVMVKTDGTGYYEFSCPGSWNGSVSVDVVESVDKVARMSDIDQAIGNIGTALDELHAYAQGIISGGEA